VIAHPASLFADDVWLNSGTGARERAYPSREGAELPRLAVAREWRYRPKCEVVTYDQTVSSLASRLWKGER
jgi:hypothetical protein